MNEPLIRLTDIHKSYGANHVLRGISLEVEKSEVLVIIGPSEPDKADALDERVRGEAAGGTGGILQAAVAHLHAGDEGRDRGP